MTTTLVFVVRAYLLGSISFAVLTSKAFGLADPRTYGSNNPGATNVLRSGKKSAAALTLLGDAAKGWLAVWLAMRFVAHNENYPVVVALVALAVFLGHLFPVWLGFKGGKGVATAAGVLLGFDPWLGLATIATWIVIVLFFRISSFAALVAALFAPAYAWWLFGMRPLLAVVGAIALLLVWRHRANIGRLIAGVEPRIR